MSEPVGGAGPLAEALTAAQLFAVDPALLGGIALRAPAGPVRDGWLALLRSLLLEKAPFCRVPLHVAAERLLGGLDLAATMAAGRPVAERGLLAAADGGVLALAMAERLEASTVAAVTAAMDHRMIVVERDGLALRLPSRFGVLAFDEGIDGEEALPPALADRLAFWLDLAVMPPRDAALIEVVPSMAEIVATARRRLPEVVCPDVVAEALAATAMALGIDSLRAVLLALATARVAAALDGRLEVDEADTALAARLVLAPRATCLPAPPPAEDEQAPEDEKDDAPAEDAATTPEPEPKQDEAEAGEPGLPSDLDEIILEAAKAAIPERLLAQLQATPALARSARTPGKAGGLQQSTRRGRPLGTRRGTPRGAMRLDLVATLRAAAPWQPLRRPERMASAGDAVTVRRVDVRPDDFRIKRFKQRTETVVVFVVDASGSTAFNRLAEAKGAVELLLADCYVRRESVALIAFRGRTAELLLPPTRSLTRAKRSLGGLPGGGGTPLAAGLEAALELGQAIARKGQTPIIVFLSDGRGNVARDGSEGRRGAVADIDSAALRLRAAGLAMLFVDTSPRPQPDAQALARAMAARYLALPRADAQRLSAAVKAGTSALRALD